jgi:hypothetical protein
MTGPLSLAVQTLDMLDSDPTGAVRKVDSATVMAVVADVHAMGTS